MRSVSTGQRISVDVAYSEKVSRTCVRSSTSEDGRCGSGDAEKEDAGDGSTTRVMALLHMGILRGTVVASTGTTTDVLDG